MPWFWRDIVLWFGGSRRSYTLGYRQIVVRSSLWFGGQIHFGQTRPAIAYAVVWRDSPLRYTSGPMIVNWGDWPAKPRENVMLISTITPFHTGEMNIAQQARQEGALVIGIGPATLDGETPPNGTFAHCQVHFENFSPESHGVIRDSRPPATDLSDDRPDRQRHPADAVCAVGR